MWRSADRQIDGRPIPDTQVRFVRKGHEKDKGKEKGSSATPAQPK